MTQQSDPTIPFDASVVDEEALRALRAVQRSLPQGDGSASGALVGGTEAAAGLGIGRGIPVEGGRKASPDAPSVDVNVVPPATEAPREMPDPGPPEAEQPPLDLILPEPLPLEVAAPQASPSYRFAAAGSAASPGALAAEMIGIPEQQTIAPPATAQPPLPWTAPPIVTTPDPEAPEPEEPTVRPPVAEEPEPEEPIRPPQEPETPEEPEPPSEEPETPPEEPETPPQEPETPPQEPVRAEADAPVVRAADVSGDEDAAIPLDLSAALTDVDGSETLSVSILGIPAGASLSHGSRMADGSWSVDPADLPHLVLTPPENFSGTLDLTLKATARESEGGSTAISQSSFQVQVEAVADAPLVVAQDAVGREDQPIALDLSAALADTDGSEVLSVVIEGVPAGARLSAGSDNGDGTWTLVPSQLHDLTLAPPSDWNGAITLTLVAHARETANGSEASTRTSFRVQVESVADAPSASATDAAGIEDQPIALDLAASLADLDGSEALSICILGIPAGASLSHGSRQSDGSWSVDPADLEDLTLTPPRDFSGRLDLTLQATAHESDGGSTAVTQIPFRVQVEAVADAPQLVAGDVSGQEDKTVPLDLASSLADADGSERLSSVIVSGLPDGFSLTRGSRAPDGSWSVDPADLPHLALVPPRNFSGAVDLAVQVTAQETSNGATATTQTSFRVQVEAVADLPVVGVSDAAGVEDTAVGLVLSAALVDTDGSEVLSLVIEGLPAGARLSAGLNNGDGTWTLTPAQLPNLTLTPPEHWSGPMSLTLAAHARETATGAVATTRSPFTVQITPEADAPLLSARDAAGLEDSPIPLALSAALVDRDGSETLTLAILGLPAGATLSHGSRQPDGSWSLSPADLAQLTLTPPRDVSGPISLTVQATAREPNGSTATRTTTFQVQVAAVADAPSVVVADAQGLEDKPVRLDGLSGALSDRDGSEGLSFVLAGVPANASLSAGTRQADGSWLLTPAQLAGLTLTPPAQFSGQLALTLTAVATETSNGASARTAAAFTVRLDPVLDAGTISGSASGSGSEIVLKPTFATPDADGSETWSALAQVTGLPAGVTLTRGSEVSPGVWQVATADLRNGLVKIRLVPNSDADFAVKVTATLTDSGNGKSESREVTGTIPVTVSAVADAPAVTVHDAAGREDTAIALDLAARLTDLDGSEVLTVAVLGLPAGAVLSHGSRQADGSWSVAVADLGRVSLTPPKDFSGVLDLTLQASARESVGGSTAVTKASFRVTVDAVADTPIATVSNASGQEDHTVALNLGATLTDTDGSEQISSVIVSGLPDGFGLSHGASLGAGRWQVPKDNLTGLTLTPAPNWNGTLQLKLEVTSTEADSGSSATTTKPFTVVVAAVNDAPDVVLAAPDHASAGAHQADALGGVQAQDIDSTHLGGATITLSGSQPSDRLDIDGFTLHVENGRMMIGDTGIELVGGGYSAASGSVTLIGNASPQTYAAVLQSLVLESTDASGLAAGTRSIAVTLFDSAGAASTSKTVDVVVDDIVLPGDAHGFTAATADPVHDNTGADILLLMADNGSDVTHAAMGAWTDQVEPGNVSDPAPSQTSELDQPVADHVLVVDDFQADLGRANWS